MKIPPFKRLKSTRLFVERSEARIHRLAAACTLAVRDLNEDRIDDVEQKMIRQDLKVVEDRLWSCIQIMEMSKNKAARANLAQAGTRSGLDDAD